MHKKWHWRYSREKWKKGSRRSKNCLEDVNIQNENRTTTRLKSCKKGNGRMVVCKGYIQGQILSCHAALWLPYTQPTVKSARRHQITCTLIKSTTSRPSHSNFVPHILVLYFLTFCEWWPACHPLIAKHYKQITFYAFSDRTNLAQKRLLLTFIT